MLYIVCNIICIVLSNTCMFDCYLLSIVQAMYTQCIVGLHCCIFIRHWIDSCLQRLGGIVSYCLEASSCMQSLPSFTCSNTAILNLILHWCILGIVAWLHLCWWLCYHGCIVYSILTDVGYLNALHTSVLKTSWGNWIYVKGIVSHFVLGGAGIFANACSMQVSGFTPFLDIILPKNGMLVYLKIRFMYFIWDFLSANFQYFSYSVIVGSSSYPTTKMSSATLNKFHSICIFQSDLFVPWSVFVWFDLCVSTHLAHRRTSSLDFACDFIVVTFVIILLFTSLSLIPLINCLFKASVILFTSTFCHFIS